MGEVTQQIETPNYSEIYGVHVAGCQKVSAEQRGYAGTLASSKIAENNFSNTTLQEGRLLEEIREETNLKRAIEKVKSNKGAAGIDGMKVDELRSYFNERGETLI